MNLLADGLVLLLLGQTVVFLFLGLMVLAIRLTAVLIARWAPSQTAPPSPPPVSAPPKEESAEIPAAIAAALHRHRNRFTTPTTP
jgi:sodium pump decarboxylase gamma subunit